jgi:UDP-2,3-diacylglucosamine pyrophosphatase LpxH
MCSLRSFAVSGGSLTLIVGNHDLWMSRRYEAFLGAGVVAEPIEVESFGRRVRLEHGHRRGSTAPWKVAMESRAFLMAFGAAPGPIARLLDGALERSNDSRRARSEAKHIAVYREHARSLRGRFDLVVMGHVHQATDDLDTDPQLIVLGDWIDGTNYLKIDEAGLWPIREPRRATNDAKRTNLECHDAN